MQASVAIASPSEFVYGGLGLVALLMDVIQDARELTSSHKTGEHGYDLAGGIEEDEGGKCRYPEGLG